MGQWQSYWDSLPFFPSWVSLAVYLSLPSQGRSVSVQLLAGTSGRVPTLDVFCLWSQQGGEWGVWSILKRRSRINREKERGEMMRPTWGKFQAKELRIRAEEHLGWIRKGQVWVHVVNEKLLLFWAVERGAKKSVKSQSGRWDCLEGEVVLEVRGGA